MSNYTDGFVVPVSKARLEDYIKAAKIAQEVWLEYGALEYREWVAEDTDAGNMRNFPQLAGLEESEVAVLAWITYRDRAHRDEVNAKAMADKRLVLRPI